MAAPAVQDGSPSERDETASRDLKRAHVRVTKEEREQERRRNRRKAELERVRQAALKASKVCDARKSDVRSMIVVSVHWSRAKRPASALGRGVKFPRHSVAHWIAVLCTIMAER